MFILFCLYFVSFVFMVFASKAYRPLFIVVFCGVTAMLLWVILEPII
jgi:hypothetical protein